MKSSKNSMGMQKGKPTFKEKNDIWPQEDGKKKNPGMETSIFGPDALKSDIATTPAYAKKGKGATVNKGVENFKPNMISPDANY